MKELIHANYDPPWGAEIRVSSMRVGDVAYIPGFAGTYWYFLYDGDKPGNPIYLDPSVDLKIKRGFRSIRVEMLEDGVYVKLPWGKYINPIRGLERNLIYPVYVEKK